MNNFHYCRVQNTISSITSKMVSFEMFLWGHDRPADIPRTLPSGYIDADGNWEDQTIWKLEEDGIYVRADFVKEFNLTWDLEKV